MIRTLNLVQGADGRRGDGSRSDPRAVPVKIPQEPSRSLSTTVDHCRMTVVVGTQKKQLSTTGPPDPWSAQWPAMIDQLSTMVD